jgi:hypothetical protein
MVIERDGDREKWERNGELKWSYRNGDREKHRSREHR